MSLAELRLADLRCLRAAELSLHPGFNLVTGDNGQGKTSLLEAVYLLGRGRSFRTRYTEQLIHQSASRLWVAGKVVASPGPETADPSELASDRGHRVDLQCSRQEGAEARIDAQRIGSLVELSELFPVQVIEPGIHRLLEEGPARRRHWLDWTVFHVEPGFFSLWQGYTRALRQRNAALQTGADPTPWEAELGRLGETLTAARARLLENLQPTWSATLQALDAVPATLSFYPGWSRQHSLADSLAQQRTGDQELGRTRLGPHRFDVLIRVAGRPARDVISRGQQKLLGAAMALSMARHLARAADKVPTLLLDDPAAELDQAHAAALLAAVAELGGQHIVTAMHPETLPPPHPDRVFHVEHGGVKPL
ncbi:MAG: DNA replication/repair protein RecF [Steroidobacteraceae bacterium]